MDHNCPEMDDVEMDIREYDSIACVVSGTDVSVSSPTPLLLRTHQKA